jgi:hypothetical protein
MEVSGQLQTEAALFPARGDAGMWVDLSSRLDIGEDKISMFFPGIEIWISSFVSTPTGLRY